MSDKRALGARLFVGVAADDEARRGLEGVVKKLKRKHWKVRWEKKEKWHMTLVFMGKAQELRKVKEVLKRVESGWEHGSPELRFKGLETFPRRKISAKCGERMRGRSMRRIKMRSKVVEVLPKVIWVRVGGEVRLVTKAAKELRSRLTGEGIWFDPKPLVPHVTLGRLARGCGRGERIEMGREIGKLYSLNVPQRWRVDRLRLYKSILSEEGSRYVVLDEIMLK